MTNIQDVYGHLKTLTKKWFYDKTEVDNKLSNKESTSNKIAQWSNSPDNNKYPSEKLVKDSLDGKANSSHTHIRFEIDDFPDIPYKTSDLTNDGDDGAHMFVKDNDSRLRDARTPTVHYHTKSEITDFPTSMTPSSHTHAYTDLEVTNIGTTIDLNDYRTAGHYHIWGTVQVNNVNAPDSQGGLLIVEVIPNGVSQTLIQYWADNPRMFYRIYHNTAGWRAWQEISTNKEHGSTNILNGHPINDGNGGVTYAPITRSDGAITPTYRLNLSSVSDTTKYNELRWTIEPVNFTYEDTFTLSFWARATANKEIKTYFYSGGITAKRLNSNSELDPDNGSLGDGATRFTLSTDWKHYRVTYKLNSTGTNTTAKKVAIRVYGGTDAYISGVKFEGGTNSTDWSPHPSKIISTCIPTSSDLNNYIETGFYYNNNNTQCESISNLAEAGKAFFLTVEDWGGSNYTKQTITHYATKYTYVRIRNAGTWTAWTKQVDVNQASTTQPKTNFYKTAGVVGTSAAYARADHQHSPFFSNTDGGSSTAGYVKILEINVTASWQDRPITFALQGRAKQTPTYVSIKLSNTNITTTNYTIDSFVMWGDTTTDLYLRQTATNTWNLIAYKNANDSYNVVNLFSGNGSVQISPLNGMYGTSKPTSTTTNPVYEATYIIGATPFGTIADMIYPVGSIYMSVNNVSPSTLFGGTWEQIKDKFLLASGTSYSNGATGGSADAIVVKHNHYPNGENYFVTNDETGASNYRVGSATSGKWIDAKDKSGTFHHTQATNFVGSDGTGKNMPPYLAVNVWKRTA